MQVETQERLIDTQVCSTLQNDNEEKISILKLNIILFSHTEK